MKDLNGFDLVQFVKLLHIVSAMLMLAGGIGRQIARSQAAKATNIQVLHALMMLSGRLDKTLVIPGSSLVLIFGLAIAWLRGWPILGFLQGSSSNWLLVSIILYLAIIPIIIYVFIPHRKILEKALELALARGEMTQELLIEMQDRSVMTAHYFEGVIVIVIIYLMVMKPF